MRAAVHRPEEDLGTQTACCSCANKNASVRFLIFVLLSDIVRTPLNTQRLTPYAEGRMLSSSNRLLNLFQLELKEGE